MPNKLSSHRDEAFVFTYPTTQKEIEDAIGVRYDGSLDLTAGIIFVKDKKIVYDELFIHDVESRPTFFVYKNADYESEPRQRVFTPSDVFICSKIMDLNRECYELVPKE